MSLPPPTLRSRRIKPGVTAPRRAGGFTLLEIMLVVAIISLLLAAGFSQLGDVMGGARDTVVQSDIQTFGQKLSMYEASNGFFPTTEQGLQALTTMPSTEPRPTKWYQAMQKIPKDPWQQEYVYVQPGVHNPQSYDIYSKGKDRIAGTSDDVGNWENK